MKLAQRRDILHAAKVISRYHGRIAGRAALALVLSGRLSVLSLCCISFRGGPLSMRGQHLGKLGEKLLSGDTGCCLECRDKSLFRRCEKEGLKGEINNMRDTAYAASFCIEFNLLNVSL